MDQSEFVKRLFDNKPIQVFPVRRKVEWRNGARTPVLTGLAAKCSHCGKEMNIAGFTNRLIVGATCSDCLERARFARTQAG